MVGWGWLCKTVHLRAWTLKRGRGRGWHPTTPLKAQPYDRRSPTRPWVCRLPVALQAGTKLLPHGPLGATSNHSRQSFCLWSRLCGPRLKIHMSGRQLVTYDSNIKDGVVCVLAVFFAGRGPSRLAEDCSVGQLGCISKLFI
jgi:hypothetical protein